MKHHTTTESYKAAVEYNLKGLGYVSTGACLGCAECGLADKRCPDCRGFGVREDEHDCPIYKGEGTVPCDEKDRDSREEPGFSWSPCDCCGSSLGGDRHPAHGRSKDDSLIHLDVCTDCLFYINYGDLPEL